MTQIATLIFYTDCFTYMDCQYDAYVFPNNSKMQYVMCGSTIEKCKLFKTLVFRMDLNLFTIPVHLNTFLEISAI